MSNNLKVSITIAHHMNDQIIGWFLFVCFLTCMVHSASKWAERSYKTKTFDTQNVQKYPECLKYLICQNPTLMSVIFQIICYCNQLIACSWFLSYMQAMSTIYYFRCCALAVHIIVMLTVFENTKS